MNDSNSSWTCTTTVAYGCLPFDRQFPDFVPPWYPNLEPNPFLPNPLDPNPYDPNQAPFVPSVVIGPYTWPPKTTEQIIFELEQRCAMFERRLAALEAQGCGRPEVSGPTELSVEDKPYEPARLPCTCDELPLLALHWEGCPAGRDQRSHDDGLEFLRVWIDGHFDKLELDSPTLYKIKQMIDVIGTKMRRRKAK